MVPNGPPCPWVCSILPSFDSIVREHSRGPTSRRTRLAPGREPPPRSPGEESGLPVFPSLGLGNEAASGGAISNIQNGLLRRPAAVFEAACRYNVGSGETSPSRPRQDRYHRPGFPAGAVASYRPHKCGRKCRGRLWHKRDSGPRPLCVVERGHVETHCADFPRSIAWASKVTRLVPPPRAAQGGFRTRAHRRVAAGPAAAEAPDRTTGFAPRTAGKEGGVAAQAGRPGAGRGRPNATGAQERAPATFCPCRDFCSAALVARSWARKPPSPAGRPRGCRLYEWGTEATPEAPRPPSARGQNASPRL